MRLKLPNVTLVAVDTVAHDLTAMAIKECIKKVEFADVVVFSDKVIQLNDPLCNYALVPIHKTETLDDVMNVLWYEVPKHIRSSHVLIIQWDSWVLNPEAWNSMFLDYDYIGAPWWYKDRYNVGNGGFSLRSLRLMEHMMLRRYVYSPASPEDEALCRSYGPHLRGEGFLFAPNELAYRFSFERARHYGVEPFGFHGMFNWPLVLTDTQIRERLKLAPPYVLKHVHYQQMLEMLRAMGRSLELEHENIG
jgi:hypothetical protein